jgi:hypothetical protein
MLNNVSSFLGGGVLGFALMAYTLSQSTSPFFVMGFFQDRVSQTICLGWLRTAILKFSASQVARITGVSHWCQSKVRYNHY